MDVLARLPIHRGLIETIRHYHRLQIDLRAQAPAQPTLFVANHGFGSVFDLNVYATLAALDALNLDRPVTTLMHQLAWRIGLGPVMEYFGAVPASPESAREAFSRGHHVLVFPGGDLDGFKTRADKDRIVFSGRHGFARLAQEYDVPIIPIVTSGAGNTVWVLDDGQGIARALRLNRLLRLKGLPVSVAAPWGLNVGVAGFLPYLPFPAQLHTTVLPTLTSQCEESADELATRVIAAMQGALNSR